MLQGQQAVISLLVILVVAIGCGGGDTSSTGGAGGGSAASAEDAARDALNAMLKLAEAGDWGEYVDRFYGEAHKFSSSADRDALVKRFEDQWGAEVTAALKRASAGAPVIDGAQAKFEVDGEPAFVLHRADDGKWTFHL